MSASSTSSATDTLIFPSASASINTISTELRRSNLSITNRLHYATFVLQTAESIDNLPLIANERCGSWYIPANHKAGSAYFKSTDGHHGQWAFSLRRLNLQVLDVVEKARKGGCIIVDSTRRGKSIPDALSKTVPIWSCVLNRLLFPNHPAASELRTPEDVVSRSEHAQIAARIPAFVEHARSLSLDLDVLRAKLAGKPMKAVWVTPDSAASEKVSSSFDHQSWNLIVLCTASSRSSTNPILGANYVQGAADDHESWALGLSAATFWARSERLLAASEDELPVVIAEVVASSAAGRGGEVREATLVRPMSGIWVGSNATAEAEWRGYDVVVSCAEKASLELVEGLQERYIHLACGGGKVGSRQLRAQLAKLDGLGTLLGPASKVLVTCHTGKDLAIGVALALLCRFCDGTGGLQPAETTPSSMSKAMIKHRLSWIMVSIPDASPSRATLQSVNAYLLGG